jgi:hypothetical protein
MSTRHWSVPCTGALVAVLLLLAPAHGQAAGQSTGTWRVPHEAREQLVGMKATVLHGTHAADGSTDGSTGVERDYDALLTRDQVDQLRGLGFELTPVPSAPPTPAAAGGWTSHAEMRAGFQALADTHPSIARFVVLGSSVQGRDVFALRISDNVHKEEVEPEILFCGAHHGDEFASANVPYQYAQRLCNEYGSDPSITQWVDDNEIWILPLVNPDGYEAGTRNNANNVDINRDYGFQWDAWGGSPEPFSQPEVRVLRDLFLANNFSLVSTMHCSGNVFLYTWGNGPWNVPELAEIQAVGGLYAQAANYTLKNSWADYETHGETLDFAYGSHGALCFTAEISNSLASFTNTYDRNESGMDLFCASLSGGLHGTVTDARSGAALWAQVWVSGSSLPSYTDPTRGDLHRLLEPGTYDVTIRANGYLPTTVSDVVIGAGSPADIAVALQRGGREHAFMVQAVNQNDPLNNHANITSPSRALGPPDGLACSLGREGFIVLDVGASHAIVNGPGDDLLVTEALLPGDMTAEGYSVYVGDAYDQDVLIGAAVGSGSFDLGAAGVGTTRYVKIVDRSGASPADPLAGMDLDAITILNGRRLRSQGVQAKPTP